MRPVQSLLISASKSQRDRSVEKLSPIARWIVQWRVTVAVMDDEVGSYVIILEITKISPMYRCIARIMGESFRTPRAPPNRCAEKLNPIAPRITMAVIDDDLGSCVILEITKISPIYLDIARIMRERFRSHRRIAVCDFSRNDRIASRRRAQYRNLIKTKRESEREREREREGQLHFYAPVFFVSYVPFRSLLLCRSIFPLTQ